MKGCALVPATVALALGLWAALGTVGAPVAFVVCLLVATSVVLFPLAFRAEWRRRHV